MSEGFNDYIAEYGVRPESVYGELNKEIETKPRVRNSYEIIELSKKDPVPFMQDWHGVYLRLRIIFDFSNGLSYQCTLEKPFLGHITMIKKSKNEFVYWFEKLNRESQSFINDHYEFIKINKPIVFDPPSIEEIHAVSEKLKQDIDLVLE